MQFWQATDTFLGIFLTLALVGLIITNSQDFVRIVSAAGNTTSQLFRTMSFQQQAG